jgi:hypothetical protein
VLSGFLMEDAGEGLAALHSTCGILHQVHLTLVSASPRRTTRSESIFASLESLAAASGS